ncbi:hypothetical protein NS212_06735 [Pseudomonas parafulva]|nr:hypothetical protein NS212_06735 [Pseudomonas parafulva]
MTRSGKGSLRLLTLLQRSNHARLQPPFGDLQITVQTIDHIHQQALLLQLTLANRTLQYHPGQVVVDGQLPVTVAIGQTQVRLVRGEGLVEQSADSFHPDYSLA